MGMWTPDHAKLASEIENRDSRKATSRTRNSAHPGRLLVRKSFRRSEGLTRKFPPADFTQPWMAPQRRRHQSIDDEYLGALRASFKASALPRYRVSNCKTISRADVESSSLGYHKRRQIDSKMERLSEALPIPWYHWRFGGGKERVEDLRSPCAAAPPHRHSHS